MVSYFESNIINVFTVTFDQCNASFMNKNVILLKKSFNFSAHVYTSVYTVCVPGAQKQSWAAQVYL